MEMCRSIGTSMHLTPFHAVPAVQDLGMREIQPRSPAIGGLGQEGYKSRRTGIPLRHEGVWDYA